MNWTRVFTFLVFFLVILTGIGILLPASSSIQRSYIINAPADLLYQLTSDEEAFNSWNNLNSNKITTKLIEEKKGKYLIKERRDGDKKRYHTFQYSKANNGTKVTWTIKEPVGLSPVKRIRALSEDKDMAARMEKGLRDLRDLSDRQLGSQQRASNNASMQNNKPLVVKEINFPGQDYLAARKVLTMRNMPGHFANYFPLLYSMAYDNGMTVGDDSNGSALFFDWDESKGTVDVAAAMAVDNAKDLADDIKAIKLPPAKAVSVDFFGDMNEISKAHMAIQEYLTKRGLKMKPPTIEEYVSNPEEFQDPNKALARVIAFYE